MTWLSKISRGQLFILTVVLAITVLLSVDRIFQETFGKRQIVVEIKDAKSQSLILTDQGTFTLDPTGPRRKQILDEIFRPFWRDTAEQMQKQLTMGCSYEVVITNGMFDDHPLGVNRAPAQTKIIKVLRRIQNTESSCDVSNESGKPVCREDQVKRTSKEIFPLEKNCDFETFLWDSFSRSSAD